MKERSNCLVSVVIPTYYRNDRLRKALESVAEQHYRPIEAVVVDGSDDDSAAPIVQEFDFATHIRQESAETGITGAAGARDIGVSAASGSLIHFLDDDDQLLPDAISKQVALVEADEDVGLVYCGIQWEHGRTILPSEDLQGDALMQTLSLQTAPCVPSTMLVRRALFDEIPPMAELPHDDTALLIELARRSKFDFVDEALVVRGKSEGALSNSQESFSRRRATIDHYAELYDEYPPEVKETALARVYFQAGVFHLHERAWSPESIKSFVLANYYAPSVQPVFIASFITALFGRGLWNFGIRVFNKYFRGDQHGNIGKIESTGERQSWYKRFVRERSIGARISGILRRTS